MKKYLFFSFLVFALFSCKSNNSASDGTPVEIDLEEMEKMSEEEVNLEVDMDKPIEDDQLAKKMLVESQSTKVSDVAKVEDKNETKLVGKSKDAIKKEKELKLESTKEIINSSVNKGKSCEEILAEQTELVKSFEKSKDRKIVLDLAKGQNDPFFKQCLEVKEFSDKVDALAARLEKAMD